MKPTYQDLIELIKAVRPYIAKMSADKANTVVPPSHILKRINDALAKAEAR